MNTGLIGVVGCSGDFGSRFSLQAMDMGKEVLGFDISDRTPVNVTRADEVLSRIGELIIPRADSIEQLFSVSTDIHWGASVEAVEDAPPDTGDGVLTLHCSTMSESLRAYKSLKRKSWREINIAHVLMNEERMVVVAEESDEPDNCVATMRQLGFDTTVMSIEEHDFNQAISQGPAAAFHERYIEMLIDLGEKGLLTPSGRDWMNALTSRNAEWTEATVETILSNKQLTKVFLDLADMVRVKNGLN